MRGQVLQRELVFLRAPFGFAAMRNVLQQHGVDAAGAQVEVDDREFHVAAFIIAADELRGTVLGGLVGLPAASETGVSKIVATSRRRISSSDAPIRRCACGFASSTRRDVGSNRTMPEAARSKIAR